MWRINSLMIGLVAALLPLSAQTTLVQVLRDGNPGTTGLDGAAGAILSPDGRFLYVAARFENAVSVYQVDPVSGLLSLLEEYRDETNEITGLDGVLAMDISPDGAHLYAAAFDDDTVTVFSRDNDSGRLTWVENWRDGTEDADGLNGTRDLKVSPDGNHVYVLGSEDDTITVFNRAAATGALTFNIAYTRVSDNDEDLLTFFDFPGNLIFNQAGTHLYVTTRGGGNLYLFTRNTSNGELTVDELYRDTDENYGSLSGADAMVLSDDERFLYVAADYDNTIHALTRDTGTGRLTSLAVYTDDDDSLDGLDGVGGVALSPDGNTLYATARGDSALTVWNRDSSAGTLTQSELLLDDSDQFTTLGGAALVLPGPNGNVIYALAREDDAVNVLATSDPGLADVALPNFLKPSQITLDDAGNLHIDLPDPHVDGTPDNNDNLGYLVTLQQSGTILEGPFLVTPPTVTTWPFRLTIDAGDLPAGKLSVGVRRAFSLAQASDEVIFPVPDNAVAQPPETTAGYKRWLTHVPRQAGGFDATILLANRDTEADATVNLVAFDSEGIHLATEVVVTPMDGVLELPIYGDHEDSLFRDFTDLVSHVAIWEASPRCKVSLAAISRASSFFGVLPEQDLDTGEHAGSSFVMPARISPAAEEGLAVLNLSGEREVAVELVQMDNLSGDVLDTVSLGTVPVGAKRLFVLSNLVAAMPGSSYHINTVDPADRIQAAGLSLGGADFLAAVPLIRRR
ncbi:MAG: beta-propeller fold lactonase family protein [Acidobacteriota bacterium]|nr:beta-propeller fold lactonase family protein [Acidobacteriota bacterium]